VPLLVLDSFFDSETMQSSTYAGYVSASVHLGQGLCTVYRCAEMCRDGSRLLEAGSWKLEGG